MTEELAKEELSKTAQKLLIPVNEQSAEAPDTPADRTQFEYVNPVTLKNRLILYSNAVIEATEKLNNYNDQVASGKKAKHDAERDLSEYESRLLRTFPPERNLTTLKLVQAYLERIAADKDGTPDQYFELRTVVADAEDTVALWQGKADKIRAWLKAIDTASQNITTHLSYIKFDSKLGR